MTIVRREVECCPECLALKGDVVLDTIYECDCGNEFSREQEGTHKCPDCGHFASVKTYEGCPECCVEVGKEEVYECLYCGKIYKAAEDAYKCCSEGKGEEKPPEVVAEETARENARLARLQREQESLERVMAEHPPKYKVGDIIKDIDLSSRGSFNRQAFVDAEVVKLISGESRYGVLEKREWYGWKYVLAGLPDKVKQEHLSLLDIEYQTGRADPSREHRWCCPWTVVGMGETCPKCGKKFEDIPIKREAKPF